MKGEYNKQRRIQSVNHIVQHVLVVLIEIARKRVQKLNLYSHYVLVSGEDSTRDSLSVVAPPWIFFHRLMDYEAHLVANHFLRLGLAAVTTVRTKYETEQTA